MNAQDPTHRLYRIATLWGNEKYRAGLWALAQDPAHAARATRYQERSYRLFHLLLAELRRVGNRIDDLEERVANGIPSDAVIDRIAEYHHANVKEVPNA